MAWLRVDDDAVVRRGSHGAPSPAAAAAVPQSRRLFVVESLVVSDAVVGRTLHTVFIPGSFCVWG